MRELNEFLDIFNEKFKDKILSLRKSNFIKIFYISQDFEINKKEEMILSAKLRSSISNEVLMSYSYDYKNKISVYTCKFCNIVDNNLPCHHLAVMLEDFNNGELDRLIYEDEKIDTFFTEKRKKEKERQYQLLKEKNELILDSLVNMLEKNDYIPINAKIELQPVIIKSNDKYYMELKIGNGKMYVIKDIQLLLKDIKNSETKQFGKNVSLNLNINNFDEKSKLLISSLNKMFALDTFNQNGIRLIDLNDEVIDDVFDIYKGSIVKINYDDILVDDVFISGDIVELNVEIRDMKFYVEGLEYSDLILGYKNDYLLKNNVIKKLISNDNVRELIRFIYKNPEFEIEYVKDRFLKDVYTNVLDDINVDDKFKEEFTIKDFSISAYFDMEEGVIQYYTKYFVDGEEVMLSKLDDNVISAKLAKFNKFLSRFGFVNNKLLDTGKVVLFLGADFSKIKNVATIYLSDNIKKMQVKKIPKVQNKLGYDTGMLSICFENLNYSNEELNKIIHAIRRKVKYVKLNKNTIVEIEDVEANQLLKIVEEFNLDTTKLAEVQRVPLYQSLKLLSNKDEFNDFTIDDIIIKLLDDISNYKNSDFEVPIQLKESMRSYQIDAFKWMKTLMKYDFCGVLADDMGLGKTLEIIALLMSDVEERPSLIVCPKSLAYNWRNEFIKWETKMKVINVNGTSAERAKIIKNINHSEKVVYISSYDSLKNDLDFYQNVNFKYMILDEAQFIKNHMTLKAQSVKKINSEIRFILTGTPIENTVVDLWSLFDFLMPNYLYNYNHFKKMFEKEITSTQNNEVIKELVKKITPFILRRTKQDVLTDLPEKVETVRYAEMLNEQRKVYEAQLLKTKKIIKEGKNKVEILSSLTRLRQLCVDPSLFIENYNGESAKIELVIELIKKYTDEGHKIILFSQFTSVFEKIEKKLRDIQIKYFVLTGKTDALSRVEMTKVFNIPESEEKVFLVSLKAGGTGLNLIGADIVIHLDPWWNISAENQATDRAHRIGQKNVVRVIKLVCENSIEQKVIELQEIKKQIINKVIADNDNNIVNLSDDDLKYILS